MILINSGEKMWLWLLFVVVVTRSFGWVKMRRQVGIRFAWGAPAWLQLCQFMSVLSAVGRGEDKTAVALGK